MLFHDLKSLTDMASACANSVLEGSSKKNVRGKNTSDEERSAADGTEAGSSISDVAGPKLVDVDVDD